jgi:hypothetical protein
MKRRWREVLSTWKDDCIREGINYATIPKKVRYQEKTISTGTVRTIGTYPTGTSKVPVPYCTISKEYRYRYGTYLQQEPSILLGAKFRLTV